MSTYQIDTTPHAGSFIKALQNLPWSPTDAIAEFVDNSFGAGRGDAALVWVQWHKGKRLLQVFDDGKGMEDISALFKIERLPDNFVPGDIGKFGFGGTFALLWLSSDATVWTLRDGVLSYVEVNWDKQAKNNSYNLTGNTKVATEKNTPPALYMAGHGTMIHLHVPGKRSINQSNAKRDLTLNYGPALRHGKKLYWRDAKSGDLTPLADQAQVPEPTMVNVAFDLDGFGLEANGEVGIAANGTAADSGISICYGPRLLIPNEKQCFHSPNGTGKIYSGIGVRGYVDLNHAWMEGEFLTTTKSRIDDARARDRLMGELFYKLEPLLQAQEREQRQIKLKFVIDEMNLMFNRAMTPKLKADPEGQEMGGEGEKEKEPTPPRGPVNPDPRPVLPEGGEEKAKKETQEERVSLNMEPASDHACSGLICLVELQGDKFMGLLNEDYPRLVDQLEGKGERGELYAYVAMDLAREMVNAPGWKEVGEDIFGRKVMRELEALKPKFRQGKVARLLIDRIEGGGAT